MGFLTISSMRPFVFSETQVLILLLQQRKREIANAALAGADRAGALCRDDLLELLS